MASNAHGSHVNNAATIGTNYECAECHSSTVGSGNNELITSYTNHVDGTKTVTGAKVDSPYTSPSCSGTYCHSSGQAPAASATSFEYYTMDWTADTIGDCKGCHGKHTENAFASTAGEPNYTNDGRLVHRAKSVPAKAVTPAPKKPATVSTTSHGEKTAPVVKRVPSLSTSKAVSNRAGKTVARAVPRTKPGESSLPAVRVASCFESRGWQVRSHRSANEDGRIALARCPDRESRS